MELVVKRCVHPVVVRQKVPLDKGYAALLACDAVYFWRCTACRQRFAPIGPDEMLVKMKKKGGKNA